MEQSSNETTPDPLKELDLAGNGHADSDCISKPSDTSNTEADGVEDSTTPIIASNDIDSPPAEKVDIKEITSPSDNSLQIPSEDAGIVDTPVADVLQDFTDLMKDDVELPPLDPKMLGAQSSPKGEELSVPVRVDDIGDDDDEPGALTIDEAEELDKKLPNETLSLPSPGLNDITEERSFIASPETQRANDTDDSIVKSRNDESRELILESSVDERLEAEWESKGKKTAAVDDSKTSNGTSSKSKENEQDKERQTQDGDQSKMPDAKTNPKPSANVRHRSQRLSASSASSCPCCVESVKSSPSQKPIIANNDPAPQTPTAVVDKATPNRLKNPTRSKHPVNSSDTPPNSQPATAVVDTTSYRKNPTRSNYPVNSSDPLAKPFLVGWRRELVYRGTTDYSKGKKQASDVYYFPPTGPKIRSLPEIVRYLAEHRSEGLDTGNFTFTKEVVYISPYDRERSANTKLGSPFELRKEKPPTVKKEPVPYRRVSQESVTPVLNPGKRNRKPKIYADFISDISVPSPQSSSSEQNGVRSSFKASTSLRNEENVSDTTRRKSIDTSNVDKEDNIVISRSGRRVKAKSLEIVEQMSPVVIKKEAIESMENGTKSEERKNLAPPLDSKKSCVVNKPPASEPVTSPERPKRNAVKRIHYEELIDIDDITDEELPPVSVKKTPKPVIKSSPPEAEPAKGKENTPNLTPEKVELPGSLPSPGKGPKINFTFSKFTTRVLNAVGNDTAATVAEAPAKKKPKRNENASGMNDRLCSLSCPGRKCSLPTLHCDVCLCLFHPECMGFLKGPPKAFTCSWCKKDKGQKDETNTAKEETHPKTDDVAAAEAPPKLSVINSEEPEDNDIASDDDPEFMPVPPEVVFSQQVNHNVPMIPGIAFMRPPPPLTRAPIVQSNLLRPACNASQTSPIPGIVAPSPAATVPTQVAQPFGLASNTLRTMANLAQSVPKAVNTAVTPPPILLAKTSPTTILANGPRPTVPGSLPVNPLQVTVPGMAKGTLIYTNNPNLRFILTPTIPQSATSITVSTPAIPAPVQTGDSKVVPSQTIASQSSISPEASTSSVKVSSPVVKSPTPEVAKEPKPQTPPPPPPPPDPEPIVIDVKEMSLCDMMLKIKIPDPASGLKKAKIILKKPEAREKGPPIPKPKKRGRAKGTIMKKPEPVSETQPIETKTIVEDTVTPSSSSTTDSRAASSLKDKEAVVEESVEASSVDEQAGNNSESQLLTNDIMDSSKISPVEEMDVTTQDEPEKETPTEKVTTENQIVSKETTESTQSLLKETSNGQSETPESFPSSSSVNEVKSDQVEQTGIEKEDRPFSPLPSVFLEDDEDSDVDSVRSDCDRVPSPTFPVILKEVNYDKSARIVTTCLSNRGAQLTSPASNCARTLRYKRTHIDTGWSEEHTYSFSPKQICLSSTRKTVMTLNMPRRPFHALQSASDSLHLVFEYLTAQDLIRAGQVCRSWRKLAAQPHLWKVVKLKGLCITDWTSCAKMLDTVKTTYLDLRGMKCKEEMWNQFVGTLHHLSNIEELVFGEVPVFVLTVVASSLCKLQCLEAEYIYTDVKRLPFWDPGCISSLQKLSILRLRAPKGLELPRFLLHGGYSTLYNLHFLTHLSLTSYRNSKSTDFEFLEKMPQLEVLELGSCQDWDETAYKRLVKLKALCRLRLEVGGTAADRGLPNALTYLSRMEELTLIYFKITSSLAAAIRRLRNLWHLTLWPDMSSEGGLIVYNTLQAVRSLKKLQSFSWGIIYEDTSNTKYSRHTSKYRESADVDEWWSEELRKTPHARGIRVPLLKALAEGSKQQESKNEMQQGLIGVGHLHHKLKRVLPDTDVYIYQVPESLLIKVYGSLR